MAWPIFANFGRGDGETPSPKRATRPPLHFARLFLPRIRLLTVGVDQPLLAVERRRRVWGPESRAAAFCLKRIIIEEQSKPEREGKGQNPEDVKKPEGSKETSADIGMISKGSDGKPKAEPGEHRGGTSGK